MKNDEMPKNEDRHLSRRQLLKTGVAAIGSGLALAQQPIFALDNASLPPTANESVIGMKFEPRDDRPRRNHRSWRARNRDAVEFPSRSSRAGEGHL